MVGIVLVSHSRPLAVAAKALVLSMTGPDLPLVIAAGAGDQHAELGTDAVEIAEAVASVMGDAGVLILMDMGSAILSAEMALELLDEDLPPKVHLCAAPFLEGAVAAGVTAKLGRPLADVAREAQQALRPKQDHLEPDAATQAPPTPAAPAAAPSAAAEIESVVTIPNAHGLHARPAARFVREASRFDAEVTLSNVTTDRGPVSAGSLSAVISLGGEKSHTLRIRATGPQAREAVEALHALVESGLGDTIDASPVAASAPPPQAPPHRALPIAEGIAIGPALMRDKPRPDVPTHPAEHPDTEKQKLQAARAAAKVGLEQQEQRLRPTDPDSADIFHAQQVLLDDPRLIERAEDLITREQMNSAAAWQRSYEEMAEEYRQLANAYLRQRAADVIDVGRRVLQALGLQVEEELPRHRCAILIVDDLTPAQASQLADSRILGVICRDGGQTSHSAILLRAMGLPSVAQARALLAPVDRLSEQDTLALDGSTGELLIRPTSTQLADFRRRQSAWHAQVQRQKQSAHQPATTSDGRRVEIFANVASVEEAHAAVDHGAEGVGLLRTEFLFLNRQTAPSEDQQVAALTPILDALGNRPAVVRTLDAGGDKPLPYLDLPAEANPFLGVRALRIGLRQPALLQAQLRALLRAGHQRQVRILFPMVADLTDLAAAQDQIETAHQSLTREAVPHAWPIATGIMVEIPSAALLADELAQRCDFFSIGTNDLTQYTLAADRGNPALGAYQDALHPAVLRLIHQITQAADRHGKSVAVCGEAAADVAAALIFVGLGVHELSVTPQAIPRIKEAIRRSRFADLQRLAQTARQQTTTAQVREQVAQWLADR